MRFRLIWIGKTKNSSLLALQNDYLKRLSHFIRCEVVELKDSASAEGVNEEGRRILQAIRPTNTATRAGFTVLLDVKGKHFGSEDLAKEMEKWLISSNREVNFVIGGASGVSAAVAESADLRLSLSFLTFTHEMARVILLEQLYRAFSIIKGFPYQK